ncbi:hypothetical protein H4S02_000084 [Coemansia sp. RSA 2611]|nr:hypothetical protein H4S02_000084 [Coemansia sp. RSA 2611]
MQLGGDAQGKQQRLRLRMAGPLGIARDSALHNQLILMDTPDAASSQSRVSRLEVVRPNSDNVIVVEGRGANNGSSVEAIYHVIDSRARRRSAQGPAERGYARLASDASGAPVRRALSAHVQQATLHRRAAPHPSIMQAIEPRPGQRPIAIPKSRLSKLQPAHRQMPRSTELAEGGPAHRPNGSLAVRRPEAFIIPTGVPRGDEPEIELTDSYLNDPGYDLASADLDSMFFRSFDLDQLPEAPERRLSFYNIGVKDVVRRSPSPEQTKDGQSPGSDQFVDALASPGGSSRAEAQTGLLSGIPSPVLSHGDRRSFDRASASLASVSSAAATAGLAADSEAGPRRTLGIPSTGEFAKPEIREDNVDFYIRMLTLRSAVPAEELTPPVSPQSNNAPSNSAQSNNAQGNGAKGPLRPAAAAEPPAPSTDRRLRPLSLPAGPSIHRYQQAPLSNFWPAAEPHAVRPHGGSRLESPDGCSHLLPRVSLRRPRQLLSRAKRASSAAASADPPAARRAGSNHGAPRRREFEYVPRDGRTGQSLRRRRGGSEPKPEARFVPRDRSLSPEPSARGCPPRVGCASWRGWGARADDDASVASLYSYTGRDEAARRGLWAHVFRAQPAGRAISAQPRQQRTRVRDVCAYPFQLTFNCFLWWLSPCAGLGRECRC